MLDFENKKTKFIFVISCILLALLVVIIIFYDKFDGFFKICHNALSVLGSVFTGIVIAYILSPLERFFSRKVLRKMKSGKWHKFLAIFLTYFVFIGFLTVFFCITIPQVARSIAELPPKLEEFIKSLTHSLNNFITQIESSDFYKSIVGSFGSGNFDLRSFFDSIINTFINSQGFFANIGTSIIGLLGGLYSFTANLLIGFVLSIYILASKARLSAQGKMITNAILGQQRAKRFIGVLKFSDRTFGSFIQGKIINSIITGVISGIVFHIFGLPFPQLLAVIVAVTDIIPVFGPFIGGIPCAFLVFIADPGKLLLFIILIVVIQQFDANYIAPKILGESTGLSSLGVFVAILVMGGYFGFIGMIIGIPLFAIIFELTKRSVEKKLVARGLSPDIADYYYKYSDDLSIEESQSFFKRIVDSIIASAKKAGAFFSRIFRKKDKQKDQKKNEKNNNDSDSQKGE